MIKKEVVEQLALERMNELDKSLFLVAITISSNNLIRVEIDKEDGGVSIDDCISVSRNIEHNLDRETEDFELEVSSAGLDKPLRVLKQYIKNIGQDVVVKQEGSNVLIEGVLTHADENGIKMEVTTKEKLEGQKKKTLVTQEIELPFDKIRETKIKISFKK